MKIAKLKLPQNLREPGSVRPAEFDEVEKF
jgi:hypothetical protein